MIPSARVHRIDLKLPKVRADRDASLARKLALCTMPRDVAATLDEIGLDGEPVRELDFGFGHSAWGFRARVFVRA